MLVRILTVVCIALSSTSLSVCAATLRTELKDQVVLVNDWLLRSDVGLCNQVQTAAKAAGLNISCLSYRELKDNFGTRYQTPEELSNEILLLLNREPVIIPGSMVFKMPIFRQYAVDLSAYLKREKRYTSMVGAYKRWCFSSCEELIGRAEVDALFLNLDYLERLGYATPSTHVTWDDFVDFLCKLTTSSDATTMDHMMKQGIGVGWKTLLYYMVTTSGSQMSVKDPEEVHSDHGLRWVLHLFERLHNSHIGLTPPGVISIAGNILDNIKSWNTWPMFKEGNAPIVLGQLNNALSLPESINWIVRPLPLGPGGGPVTQTYDTWLILDRVGKADKAWDVLWWLVAGDGSSTISRHFPLSITMKTASGTGSSLPKPLVIRGCSDVLNITQFISSTYNPVMAALANVTPDIEAHFFGDEPSTIDELLMKMEIRLAAKKESLPASFWQLSK